MAHAESALPRPARREDFRLVTGDGRFSADWNLAEQLHAVFLRADRSVPYGEVVQVMAAVKGAGVQSLGMITELPTEKK